MSSSTLTSAGGASEEISLLIRTLRETDQRLDELTALKPSSNQVSCVR
jgi:hypothetical protein